MDAYEVIVHCSNCGWEGKAEIRKGKPVHSKKCPICECKNLYLHNELMVKRSP